jgi:hypothetical protein
LRATSSNSNFKSNFESILKTNLVILKNYLILTYLLYLPRNCHRLCQQYFASTNRKHTMSTITENNISRNGSMASSTESGASQNDAVASSAGTMSECSDVEEPGPSGPSPQKRQKKGCSTNTIAIIYVAAFLGGVTWGIVAACNGPKQQPANAAGSESTQPPTKPSDDSPSGPDQRSSESSQVDANAAESSQVGAEMTRLDALQQRPEGGNTHHGSDQEQPQHPSGGGSTTSSGGTPANSNSSGGCHFDKDDWDAATASRLRARIKYLDDSRDNLQELRKIFPVVVDHNGEVAKMNKSELFASLFNEQIRSSKLAERTMAVLEEKSVFEIGQEGFFQVRHNEHYWTPYCFECGADSQWKEKDSSQCKPSFDTSPRVFSDCTVFPEREDALPDGRRGLITELSKGKRNYTINVINKGSQGIVWSVNSTESGPTTEKIKSFAIKTRNEVQQSPAANFKMTPEEMSSKGAEEDDILRQEAVRSSFVTRHVRHGLKLFGECRVECDEADVIEAGSQEVLPHHLRSFCGVLGKGHHSALLMELISKEDHDRGYEKYRKEIDEILENNYSGDTDRVKFKEEMTENLSIMLRQFAEFTVDAFMTNIVVPYYPNMEHGLAHIDPTGEHYSETPLNMFIRVSENQSGHKEFPAPEVIYYDFGKDVVDFPKHVSSEPSSTKFQPWRDRDEMGEKPYKKMVRSLKKHFKFQSFTEKDIDDLADEELRQVVTKTLAEVDKMGAKEKKIKQLTTDLALIEEGEAFLAGGGNLREYATEMINDRIQQLESYIKQ